MSRAICREVCCPYINSPTVFSKSSRLTSPTTTSLAIPFLSMKKVVGTAVTLYFFAAMKAGAREISIP